MAAKQTTKRMATKVITTLMTAVITEVVKDWSSLKPTERHSVVE